MPPIRILHVQDHTAPKFSGYAFRSRYVVLAQKALGLEAEVVSSARHRDFDALEEEVAGIRFHRTPWPEGAAARLQLGIPFWRERVLTAALTRRIVEVGRRFRPHVVHAHSPIFNGIAALRAARELGAKTVYEIRAFWEDDAVDKKKFAEGSFVYRQVRRLETSICRRADHVAVICGGLKADVAGRGIPEDKITIVPNGVDPDRFRPREPDAGLAARLGLSGKTVAGFVGSFFHYEGLPLLVEALAALKDGAPDLRLLLVGGGEDEEPTRARARELGVEDRVVFTGRVPHEEVGAYYALIDVLVYPRLSKRITELVTPLKPLEAWAMGKLTLGSDVGGIKELCEDCGVGRLFRAGDARDLARALREILDASPEALAAERAEGPRAVADRRPWIEMVSRILPAYQRLAGVGEAAPA